MNVLVWLRRDLRLSDNPALALAGAMGAVLPLFILDPDEWAQPGRAGRQWEFARETLRELRQDLQGQLAVRIGPTTDVLASLCRKHQITAIVCQPVPGDLWLQDCDRRVQAWAQAAGISWISVSSDAEAEKSSKPLTPFNTVADLVPGPLPDGPGFGLVRDPCPHRQTGGRRAALNLLEGFLSHRLAQYHLSDTDPLRAERLSSRLSPHLVWGSLSKGELSDALLNLPADVHQGQARRNLRQFQSRLTLRDQALPDKDLAGQGDGRHLGAFLACETGLPLVDAALRYLRATGWLPWNLRALLASSALHHLRIDLALLEHALARLFTDLDPAIHRRELARIAKARPIHPLRLAARLDPSGAFTRRWLPELAALPDDHLHQPWASPLAHSLLGSRYPRPLIDLSRPPRRYGMKKGTVHRQPPFSLLEDARQLALDL